SVAGRAKAHSRDAFDTNIDPPAIAGAVPTAEPVAIDAHTRAPVTTSNPSTVPETVPTYATPLPTLAAEAPFTGALHSVRPVRRSRARSSALVATNKVSPATAGAVRRDPTVVIHREAPVAASSACNSRASFAITRSA